MSLHARLVVDALPDEQEAEEIARRDRLDLRAQTMDRIAVDAGEEPPVAPLIVVDAWVVATLHDRAVGFQRGERRTRRLRARAPGAP